MVVHEIRNPAPIPTPTPTPAARQPEQVEEIPPVARIRHLRREWRRRRQPRQEFGEPADATVLQERSLRRMIERVNENFESGNIPIHLVLRRKRDGYGLDIYDCSGADVCSIIVDRTIPLDKIPDLIRNLQEEAGLILDATL